MFTSARSSCKDYERDSVYITPVPEMYDLPDVPARQSYEPSYGDDNISGGILTRGSAGGSSESNWCEAITMPYYVHRILVEDIALVANPRSSLAKAVNPSECIFVHPKTRAAAFTLCEWHRA